MTDEDRLLPSDDGSKEPIPLDHICGFMGCEHAEAWHGETGCIVPKMDYATIRYTAAGERLPPQERPCGCRWVEPCAPRLRKVKDGPQA